MDAVTPTVCEAVLVRSGEHGGGTTLSRVNLPSGAEVRLSAVGYDLNAIGYSASQDLVYGIGHHGHLIRITRSGGTTDLGFVRGVPWGDLSEATAGAVVGSDLVVREDDRLFSIDITPSSPTFQRVVHEARMRPEADDVDDFAVDPVDGLLYGISTDLFDRPTIVSIDPNSGTVRRVRTPDGLPRHGGSYGGVVIDSARTMYALNNEVEGRSRLYAIPYGGAATEIASGPPDDSTDAAGCLGEPTPPPPPPPPPPPTTPPPPRAATAPAPPPPPAPVTTTPVPAAAPPRPPQPQRPVTTTTKHWSPPASMPVAAPMSNEKTQQRHWALATVLLIVGGGAAAGAARRARAR